LRAETLYVALPTEGEVVVQVLELPFAGTQPTHAIAVGLWVQVAVSVRLVLTNGLVDEGCNSHVGTWATVAQLNTHGPPAAAGRVSVKSVQVGSVHVTDAPCALSVSPAATPPKHILVINRKYFSISCS
jgi:hypothetical protein